MSLEIQLTLPMWHHCCSVAILSCQGTEPSSIKYSLYCSLTHLASLAAFRPTLCSPISPGFVLQSPGATVPCVKSSESKDPSGYGYGVTWSLLRKLWRHVHASTSDATLSGWRLTRERKTRNLFASIPNAFSTTRRALLKR